MKLKGKKVLLGVSGSIAAYKVPQLIRLLQKEGAIVQVLITQNGQKFVSKLVLEALTGMTVISDLFEDGFKNHIGPARSADVILVAPATANLLGRLSFGLADDVISSTVLAAKVPVLIAPAMNTAMWENILVQENVQKLKRVYTVIDPEKGDLACGEVGEGRLANLEYLVDEVVKAVTKQDLKGKSVLITAGSTREFFDPVRFLSNSSSGKMALALAKEAFYRGSNVTIVTGAVSVAFPDYVKFIKAESANEMGNSVANILKNKQLCPDVFIAAAAVSDYRFAQRSSKKIKKNDRNLKIDLLPNVDILGMVLEQRIKLKKKIFIAGFALEDFADKSKLKKMIEAKYKRKPVDLLVVNSLSAMQSDFSDYFLMDSANSKRPIIVKSAPKDNISENIFNHIVKSI